MARIKIEDIVDHLDHDLRRALEATIKTHFKGASFSSQEVFREFVREVRRKCSTWERVPDRFVEVDE